MLFVSVVTVPGSVVIDFTSIFSVVMCLFAIASGVFVYRKIVKTINRS